MAYYSGSAIDMAAIRSALISACTAEDWSWNSGTEMLTKGEVFLRLQVVSGYLTLQGRTSAGAGNAPNLVRIGKMLDRVGYPTLDVTFPAAYEIFVFAAEVYMVVNYNVDYYQWCAFGESTVNGLPGTGMWLGASVAETLPTINSPVGPIFITATGGGDESGWGRNTAALFWGRGATYSTARNCWVHSDLDSRGWWFSETLADLGVGASAHAPLIGLLPNSWNSEAVLLPIRAYKARPSAKISLTADLQHARYTRVDNYTPGEVITLGADKWKIFPWLSKNTTERNGGGTGINGGLVHTGTFGWAIRYEGP